jgi:hypothetical protein
LGVESTSRFVSGQSVIVQGVAGATGATGAFRVTVVDSTHLDLVGSTFGGAYTNGGVVSVLP